MNPKNDKSAFIHVETPDSLHFSVSAEGSGEGMCGCVANLIHAMAQNAHMTDEKMAAVISMAVKARRFEDRTQPNA